VITADDLSPTQYLVMEVLVARIRLGEVLWTFPSTLKPTLRQLEEMNLVVLMHGVVEHTVRAYMTAEAQEHWVDEVDYVPPILKTPRLAVDPRELISVGECAAILGVSKQRVHQLYSGVGVNHADPKFPKPVARTAATPIFLRSEVEEYGRTRNTAGGRPRRKT
jgi:predicted DNA-binding transcriptional regulator AlpA